MKRLMLVAALVIEGCAEEPKDPYYVMKTGEKVYLIRDGSDYVVFAPNGGFDSVPSGTRAVVIKDDEDGGDKPHERHVTLNIEGGPRDGRVGEAERQYCRPAK